MKQTVIFADDMAKFLKVILFLVLLLPFVEVWVIIYRTDGRWNGYAAQVSLGEEGDTQKMMFGKEVIFRPEIAIFVRCRTCRFRWNYSVAYLFTCATFVYNRIYPFVKRHDRAAGSSWRCTVIASLEVIWYQHLLSLPPCVWILCIYAQANYHLDVWMNSDLFALCGHRL